MRTSRAHYGRPNGNIFAEIKAFGFFAQDFFFQIALTVFPYKSKQFFSDTAYSQLSHVIFDYRIKLFYYVQLFHLCRKVFYKLFGKRIHHAEFKIAGFFSQGFFSILISYTCGYYADFHIVHFHGINWTAFGVFNKRESALFHRYVLRFGKGGHHNVFLNIFFIRPYWYVFPFFLFYPALTMAHSCGKAKQNGSVEFLGKLVSELCVFFTLGAVRRLYHRQLCAYCMISAVLFVLTGVHSLIVGYGHHETSVYSRI